MKTRNMILATAIASALGMSGAAIAQQEYQAQQQPPAMEQPEVNVTDEQLQQFASAQNEIASIQEDFSGRLQSADDPEKAYELQVEANEKMTEAVESAGLDVETYNQIAMAVQTDPQLRERLSEHMDF